MIVRNDFLGNHTRPGKEIEEACLAFGGTNKYGENMFRVCIAEERSIKSCGAFNIWDKSLSLDERGGVDWSKAQQMLMDGARPEAVDEYIQGCMGRRPLRVDVGMQDKRKYVCDGWILEKWKPCVSTPSEWYSYTFLGQPALGPYPENGDYELVAGPTPYQLTVSEVETAIRRNFRMQDDRPASAQERMSLLMAMEEKEEAAREKQQKTMIDDALKDFKPILTGLSLEAGRIRERLAAQAGMKSHVGN